MAKTSEKIESIERGSKRRLEKFFKNCKEHCNTNNRFHKRFEVDDSHIAWGISKNPERQSLNHEDIAAVIQQGVLNFDNSEEKDCIEIAVEGLFKDYEWVDLSSTKPGITTTVEPVAQIRVVIRERKNRLPGRAKPKQLIVTAYVVKPKFFPILPAFAHVKFLLLY